MNAMASRRIARMTWAALIVMGSVATTPAAPPDRVKLVTGVEIQGNIIDATPNAIDIEVRNETKKYPIETIREIRFGDEPEELRSARTLLLRKDGARALDELNKLEPVDLEGLEKEILVELAFVRAAATTRKALATAEGLPAGQKALNDFAATYPRTHHLYAVQELLGDVLARQGKFAEAAAAYRELDKGPPAIKVRAATLKAGLLSEQEKYPEAAREYELAAKVAAAIEGDTGKRAKLGAELGRARCLTRLGKPADAILVATGILEEADADDSETLARVFAVLGDAQRAAGDRDRDALISFLTVGLVHNTVPEQTAEALFNLSELWEKTKNPERARKARQDLETSYPDSPWTKKLQAVKAS